MLTLLFQLDMMLVGLSFKDILISVNQDVKSIRLKIKALKRIVILQNNAEQIRCHRVKKSACGG